MAFSGSFERVIGVKYRKSKRWDSAMRSQFLLVFPVVVLAIAMALCGCGECEEEQEKTFVPRLEAAVKFVDEQGAPVAGVTFSFADRTFTSNKQGIIKLSGLLHPIWGVAVHEQMINEPVGIGWRDHKKTMTVTLLRNMESRWVYHAAGDTMFGRRYLLPEEGAPLLSSTDQGESATSLVSEVADVFGVADFRTVNLETVVGQVDPEEVYPGKRWILQSFPNSLAALTAMSTDAVTLANNHLRDYMEHGVALTLQALAEHDLTQIGGGLEEEEAAEPVYFDVKGMRVGVVGFTSVDGDAVNNAYPTDAQTQPGDVSDQDLWIWEPRLWGYVSENVDIPFEERRLGSAWEEFRVAELIADDLEKAEIWSSMIDVYPEMQDWVARRGHGGANRWIGTAIETERIASAKENADVLIAQMHSGYQFMPAPSEAVMQNARSAIDAGADIVICHHPHVVQGLEWYKGKLIVYSLGNFIFDQNFFATFNSLILRTVWDGTDLIAVRLLPTQLEAYRPVMMTDDGAEWVLTTLMRRSLLDAVGKKPGSGSLYQEFRAPDSDTAHAHFQFERHTAVITEGLPAAGLLELSMEPGQVAELAPCDALSRVASDGDSDLQVGIDVLGWGHFEDVDNDEDAADMSHWAYEEADYKKLIHDGCHHGYGCVELTRSELSQSDLILRTVARVPMFDHRYFSTIGDEPVEIDSTAEFSVRFFARATGRVDAAVRLDLYHFDDLDPTVNPYSALVREVSLDAELVSDGKWHEVVLDVPASALEPEDPEEPINYMMPYLVMKPTGEEGAWRIDDLSLIEWHTAVDNPPGFGSYHFARYLGPQKRSFHWEVIFGCEQ